MVRVTDDGTFEIPEYGERPWYERGSEYDGESQDYDGIVDWLDQIEVRSPVVVETWADLPANDAQRVDKRTGQARMRYVLENGLLVYDDGSDWRVIGGIGSEGQPIPIQHVETLRITDEVTVGGDSVAVETDVFSGDYTELDNVPQEFDPAEHANEAHNVPFATQTWTTDNFNNYEFSENYSDLSGIPTEFNPQEHDNDAHTVDFATEEWTTDNFNNYEFSEEFDDLDGIPSEFDPTDHDNESHSEDYITDDHGGPVSADAFRTSALSDNRPVTRASAGGTGVSPYMPDQDPPQGRVAQTVVAWTFDDGYESVYNHRDLLSNNGIPAEMGLVWDWVGSPDIGGDPVMDLDQMRELVHEYGFGALNHTVTHPYMTEQVYEDQFSEVYDNHRNFLENGIELTAYIPPYGDQDEVTKGIVSQLYPYSLYLGGGIVGGTWEGSGFHWEGGDPYAVHRVDCDNGATQTYIEDHLNNAASAGTGVILLSHKIIDGVVGDEGELQTSTEKINAIIDFVDSSDEHRWGTVEEVMRMSPTYAQWGDPTAGMIRPNHRLSALDHFAASEHRFLVGEPGDWSTQFTIDENTTIPSAEEAQLWGGTELVYNDEVPTQDEYVRIITE